MSVLSYSVRERNIIAFPELSNHLINVTICIIIWKKQQLNLTSSFPAGNENTCDVVPKDLYIEAGSSILVVCLTSCVRGKIYWTLDNNVYESRYDTTNSTHAVLSLRNFTLPRATLQCHSNDTHQVLGGTTIRTYRKKRFSEHLLSLQVTCAVTSYMKMLFCCCSKTQQPVMLPPL